MSDDSKNDNSMTDVLLFYAPTCNTFLYKDLLSIKPVSNKLVSKEAVSNEPVSDEPSFQYESLFCPLSFETCVCQPNVC